MDSSGGRLNTAASERLAEVRGKKIPPYLFIIGLILLSVVSYLIGRGSTPPGNVHTATETSPQTTPESGGEKSAEAKDEHSGEGHAEEGGPIKLEPKAELTAGIQVSTVRLTPFGDRLLVPGTVEVTPNRGAKVAPPVPGKVLRLFAAPGDRVRSGQPLVLLDSPEIAQAHGTVRDAEARIAEARAQVQTAEAGILQAQTRRENAVAALQRQKEFAQSGQIAQPTLQAAQNELNTAESELAQARTESQAQEVIVARNERLFKSEIVAKAELEQSQVAQRQAQTRVAQSDKRVGIARQALECEQRVYQGGLLNRQAIQTAEADVRAAEGDVRQARKQAEAARTSLTGAQTARSAALANLRSVEGNGHSEGGTGQILLYAPLDGTIAARSVTLGQAVERSTELFTIQNLDTVTVVANIPEAQAARVQVGAPISVTVAAYPNTRFSGVVQSIGSQVDEKTRALPVRCLVQNVKGALRAEMFARVAVTTGNLSQALLLPEDAVGEDGTEKFVFVKTGNRTYERRDVTIGKTSGDQVQILDGLKPGEAVVTTGMFVLKSEGKKGELSGHED